MTQQARPAPFFLADDRALDFLNSVASPWGKEIEWIGEGHDLLDWLEHSTLVPSSVLAQFRKEATREDLDAVAAQARELREWFRGFVGNHAGYPLPLSVLDELTPINRLLARDNCFRQVETGNSRQQNNDRKSTGLLWKQHRRWRSPDDLLLPIAEAMGEFVCRVDSELVKKCESPACTLWFNDVSQNHTRRWCSMAVCGNRAKAAAHRARKRSARAEPDMQNALHTLSEQGYAHIAFGTTRERFPQIIEELKRNRVTFKGPLILGQGESVHFTDPDGNSLEIRCQAGKPGG